MDFIVGFDPMNSLKTLQNTPERLLRSFLPNSERHKQLSVNICIWFENEENTEQKNSLFLSVYKVFTANRLK